MYECHLSPNHIVFWSPAYPKCTRKVHSFSESAAVDAFSSILSQSSQPSK